MVPAHPPPRRHLARHGHRPQLPRLRSPDHECRRQHHPGSAPEPDGTRVERHTAGAFDIRNFIGALLGLYGIILTLMGIFGDKAYEKTGGLNANLWTGLILLLTSAVFMTWARLRPIIVPGSRGAARRRPDTSRAEAQAVRPLTDASAAAGRPGRRRTSGS